MKITFDVDPGLSKIDDEHVHLARYLKNRIMTIDVFDGDSLMHFGTCKLPLVEAMRQGNPAVVKGRELDICEPTFGRYVGGLQVIVSNMGRATNTGEKDRAQPS